MKTGTNHGIAAICLAVALLAATAATLGVLARGDGTAVETVSIRGERYQYVTGGVYAYNAERIVAEGVGWDAVTLFVAVPALLLALPALRRGSLKARLFALGMLGYLFYQYLMYAVYWAFGPLFPLFVVIYPLAATGIVWIVGTMDVPRLPERFSARFPRTGMIVLSLAVGLMLVGMWSRRIATALGGNVDRLLFGATTMSVQALDLGVVVPLALATALFLWRKRPWGYLLATLLAVKGVTMAAAICAMLIVAAMVEGALDAGGLAIFATIALAAAWLASRIFASVLPAEVDAQPSGRERTARVS